MTLKEQTASIDKLQKENFDLKLKVYYLNEKLEKHSDEGVKETLKENIDMKVKLAEALRDRKAMKKKFKELEKENESLRAGAKEKAGEEAEQEEVWVLRERIERYETEIEEFRRKESEREEKMREVHLQAENGMHSEAEFEQLHDLLASETSRREAADADNHRLRDEIYRIRASQLDTPQMSRASNYSHSERDRSQSRTDRGLASQLSQTRRENEDLRRDLSAQTSMLTSRNREKDRLYQQIEDLKMNLRSGGHGSVYDHRTESRLESRDSRAQSVTSDRLLDRSVSRLGNQSATGTHVSAITESEREDFENVNGALRDRISELRLKNQDLEQQLEQAYAELEQRNADWENMVDDMEVANAEVQEMQVERNEALRLREDLEVDFDQLKGEAQEEIDRLEEELEVRVNEIYRLEEEVRMKEDDFRSLQLEMRNVSEVVVRLEDSHDAHQGETRRLEERIREFEGIVRDNEQEMNVLEGSLRESNEKLERMTVQSESAKNEISFLREEQDADKIKIGELEGLIKSLEMTIMEEKDRVREMREKLELERKERGQHGDLKAQEYEKKLNDKNDEVTRTKEEVRTLRGKVAMREQDANQWREKQEEMERGLRQALGDMSSSRAGLMKSVFKLQTELESSLEELDYTKSEMVEKEQILKDRENLLETMALENRKLTSLLDKEKAARRSDKAQLETLQSSQSVTTRRISEHKTQFTEMERQRNRDTRSLQQLENQLREQIAERNKVLLESWTRLSTVCGADWAHRNSLVTITSSTTPGKLSMETSITSAFQGFSRNFLSAVKTIESIVAGFKTKVKSVERDLWKEYQVVENALDSRTRRLDRLEALARGGIGEQSAVRTEVAKLRTENRVLKAELSVIKKGDLAAAATATATASASGSGTSTPTGSAPPTRPAPPQRTRTAIEVASDALQSGGMAVTAAAAGETGEKRWILRLRELEKRLKQEREARLLDRSMAKRKVEEARGEKEEIRKELERERVRGEKY
ncbi:hypothetical protein EDC01DRAFT_609670 [Geopyxis carbonaria]|nr:hypothetical protein EDC01DRAFT_609670 [Geopyxis carbonaria]